MRSTSMTVHLLHDGRDAEKETAQARGQKTYEQYAKAVIVGTPDAVVERIHRIAEAGADYFIVSLPRIAYDQEPINTFAREVMPRFTS